MGRAGTEYERKLTVLDMYVRPYSGSFRVIPLAFTVHPPNHIRWYRWNNPGEQFE